MLVQPQQAATVCELDLVLHTIGLSKRAQTLDPNQRPENSHKPLNLTLDLEYAHVRPPFGRGGASVLRPAWQAGQLSEPAPAQAGVAVSPGLRRGRLCRWPIIRRACRSPGACICRWNG